MSATRAKARLPAESEEVSPRLAALLFCDYASQNTDGKYNLLGIFDRVSLPESSPVQPVFFAYVRVVGVTEGNLEFARLNPDGSEGFRMRAKIERRADAPPAPGSGVIEFVTPFQLEPIRVGTHWFEVTFEDVPLGRIPLWVVKGDEALHDSAG